MRIVKQLLNLILVLLFCTMKITSGYAQEESVKRYPIKKDGIVGVMFMPPSETPQPVVIVLSGSRGGMIEIVAKDLASHGFAALALGYFGFKDLPMMLDHIPMEYFEKTINWLKSRKDIDGQHIGIYGTSRGAELTLILGSLFPNDVQAIVASSPSSVIYSGLSSVDSPAWIYHDKPVGPSALLYLDDLDPNRGKSIKNAIVLSEYFLLGMQKYPEAFAAAAIPVEQIKCPILLISGGEDKMWPSWLFAQQIKERHDKFNASSLCTVLNYPKAGHEIGIQFLQAGSLTYYHENGIWFALGGTPKENASASRDSWEKTLEFFESSLR